MIPRAVRRQVDLKAMGLGLLATLVLGALIVVGSRRLRDFDVALAGYTFACLFATFGMTYRYAVWLSKPPTRRYWRRGWEMFLAPRMWRRLRAPRLLAGLLLTRVAGQGFVLRRGFWRWAGHMLIAWGCFLAAAITFPLVFGWIHFEQGQVAPEPTYRIIFFGLRMQELPLRGVLSWCAFHGLIIASLLVLPGVMIVMYRRMAETGAVSVQRFGRDFLPLILLFLISASGLMLWASYEFMDGYFYSVIAQFHALTVIGTLIYLPFGKLFHIFQRPAQLGVAIYRAANEDRPQAECPVTGEAFAPRMQIEDLKEVLHEMEFDYRASPGGSRTPAMTSSATTRTTTKTTNEEDASKTPRALQWQDISPRGRRMLIGRAHNAVRDSKFD